MPTRRETLDTYIRAVVADMLARGVIAQQRGRSIAQILQAEGPKVMTEVAADFERVLTDVGADLLKGAVNMLGSMAKSMVASALGSRSKR